MTPLAAESNVRAIVAIGEAAPVLAAASPRTIVAASLEEAVAIADGIAQDGDTILLAPGCASFDMFQSYAERGDRFASAVHSRKGS